MALHRFDFGDRLHNGSLAELREATRTAACFIIRYFPPRAAPAL
jgi:hypothetical protein